MGGTDLGMGGGPARQVHVRIPIGSNPIQGQGNTSPLKIHTFTPIAP